MNFRSIIFVWQGERLTFPEAQESPSYSGQIPGWKNSSVRGGLSISLGALDTGSVALYSIRLESELDGQLECQLPATLSYCICQLKGSSVIQPAGSSGFFIGQAQVLAIAHPDQQFSMYIKEGKPVHFLLFTTDQLWDSIKSSSVGIEFRPFVPSLFLNSLIQAAKEITGDNKVNKLLAEQLHCLAHTAHLEQQTQKPDSALYTGELEDKVFYQLMEEMVLKLDRPIRAKEVCERYHLTQAQLNLMFEKHLGGTFASIHLKLRLEKALRLLQQTNMAMKEIADQTGFASLSHFSSMFKKKNGYAPTRVRKESGNPVSGFSAMQQV